MSTTLRHRWRLLALSLLPAGLALAGAVPATWASTVASPFAIDRPDLVWSCASHPVLIVGASPARTATARAALADLEVATGRSWPLTTDPAAADVTLTWGVPLRVGAAGEVWLQTEGHRYVSAQVVVNAAAAPGEMDGLVRHYLGHIAGLSHVGDPSEVMHPDRRHPARFQAGDLAGLRSAGTACR